MPPAQNVTTYFNFIASHATIALHPAEGLLNDIEIDEFVTTMDNFGDKTSWRVLDNGVNKPYEINITLFDALSGATTGKDGWQIPQFICTHAIMLALEGIPILYTHSFWGTEKDNDKVEATQYFHSINRHHWQVDQLKEALEKPNNNHSMVLQKLKTIIQIRKQQSAFHPNATQFTLHISDSLQTVSLAILNIVVTDHWRDLISDTMINQDQEELLLATYQTMWLSN